MTDQIPNSVRFNNEIYDLCGNESSEFFDFKATGVEVFKAFTSCWDGYFFDLSISDDELRICNLNFWSKDSHFPMINGVIPKARSEHWFEYSNINMLLDFTGTLYLGKDIEPWTDPFMMDYKELLSLEFEYGKLQSVTSKK